MKIGGPVVILSADLDKYILNSKYYTSWSMIKYRYILETEYA